MAVLPRTAELVSQRATRWRASAASVARVVVRRHEGGDGGAEGPAGDGALPLRGASEEDARLVHLRAHPRRDAPGHAVAHESFLAARRPGAVGEGQAGGGRGEARAAGGARRRRARAPDWLPGLAPTRLRFAPTRPD